ncbi:MAG: hypothetical protein ABI867_19205 [Kofleriaceae bacterium]
MRICIVLAFLSTPAFAGTHRLALGREAWSVRTTGTTVVKPGSYRADVATKAWTIEVRSWPTSSVFVQTADAQLARLVQADPALVVLRREIRAKSDWVLVVERGDGSVHGVVLRPGRHDNAICTFDVARDWAQPLAACRSLEPVRRVRMSSVRVPEVEPRIDRT